MLEHALLESSGPAGTRKPATVLLSTAIHAVIIVVLVLVPILTPQALPILATAVGVSLTEVSSSR